MGLLNKNKEEKDNKLFDINDIENLMIEDGDTLDEEDTFDNEILNNEDSYVEENKELEKDSESIDKLPNRLDTEDSSIETDDYSFVLDDEEVKDEESFNYKKEQENIDFQNNVRGSLDNYWDINDPLVRIILIILLAIGIIGFLYYLLMWLTH